MDEASIWTPHLKPGERVLWQAEVSSSLRRSWLVRRRTLAGLVGGGAAVLAVAFVIKLIDTMSAAQGVADLGAAATAPLYAALALTFAVVSVALLLRIGEKAPGTARYAVTTLRLLALDANGSLGEIAGEDIDGVVLGGRPAAPHLFVVRRENGPLTPWFTIEHIERPLEAKAIIEETFLEPPAGDAAT